MALAEMSTVQSLMAAITSPSTPLAAPERMLTHCSAHSETMAAQPKQSRFSLAVPRLTPSLLAALLLTSAASLVHKAQHVTSARLKVLQHSHRNVRKCLTRHSLRPSAGIVRY